MGHRRFDFTWLDWYFYITTKVWLYWRDFTTKCSTLDIERSQFLLNYFILFLINFTLLILVIQSKWGISLSVSLSFIGLVLQFYLRLPQNARCLHQNWVLLWNLVVVWGKCITFFFCTVQVCYHAMTLNKIVYLFILRNKKTRLK